MWISRREYETLRREHDEAVANDAECEAEMQKLSAMLTRAQDYAVRLVNQLDGLRARAASLIAQREGEARSARSLATDPRGLSWSDYAESTEAFARVMRIAFAPIEPAEPLAPQPAAPRNVAPHVDAVQVQREVAERTGRGGGGS